MRNLLLRALAVGALALASSADAAPCSGFTDVEDTSPFCSSVTWIRNRSITLGCSDTEYCPGLPVLRVQMAAFLSRMAPMVAPAITDNDGTVFGYFLSANIAPPQSLAVLNRGGVNYYLQLVPSTTTDPPNGAVQFFLPMHSIMYERTDCDEGGRKWSSTPGLNLSERVAFIVVDSYDAGRSTLRLYGAVGRNSGPFAVMSYRTPMTMQCFPIPTTITDPYELAYLGIVTVSGPLKIR